MLKRAFYYWTWFYVRLTLGFYYRRILVRGRENIPAKGAVLFAINHQNALMDPLLVATATSRHMHFLMRSDLFKRRWMGWALSTLNMIPVFRIRDGWQSLGENKKTFERTTALFRKGEALLIFPEGSHAAVRRVRPLSRGFTKIIFEALQVHPDLRVSVVPVGLNYTHFSKYFGSVSIHFGAPLSAEKYFTEPIALQANRLRDDVHKSMCKVTAHLSEDSYDELVEWLGPEGPHYLDPVAVNEAIRRRLDGVETPAFRQRSRPAGRSLALLKLPLQLINWLPLRAWRYLRKRTRDPVYISTMRFAIGLTVVPLYYAILLVASAFWMPWMGVILLSIILLSSFPLLGILGENDNM